MLLSPVKMVVLRLYLVILGRFHFGSGLLRRLLLRLVRRKGRITYVAHADFLDLREFSGGVEAEGPLWRNHSLQEVEPDGKRTDDCRSPYSQDAG